MNIRNTQSVPKRILGGVFLISGASLMLEISLTRLLAITLWHHYAFLIIACAILGFGAAGSWLSIARHPSKPFFPSYSFATLSLPLFLLANRVPFDPALISLSPSQTQWLVLIFLLLTAPFFFVGLTLISILKEYPDQAGKVYGSDLIGAATGCLGFFIMAPIFKEIEWLWFISIVGWSSAFMFLADKKQKLILGVTVIGGALLLFNTHESIIKINDYKLLPLALKQPDAKLLDTKWNATSRIDWVKSPMARSAPGLSLRYRKEIPKQIGIAIDGDQLTSSIVSKDTDVSYWEHLPEFILYKLSQKNGFTLFLNTIGGNDIKMANALGKTELTALTEYDAVVPWLNDQFQNNGLNLISENPRSYLKRDNQAYDRILVSLESSKPSGYSGMSSLKEDYIATVEGMSELLNHLTHDGWLALHKYLIPPPRAEFRYLTTLAETLKSLGWSFKEQLGVFRTVSTFMIVVKATKWTDEDIQRFRVFCVERGYSFVYSPEMTLPNNRSGSDLTAKDEYSEALNYVIDQPFEQTRKIIFDIDPVIDDKPYFYDFLKYRNLPQIYSLFDRKWEAMLEVGFLLPLLLICVCAISFVLIIVPVLFNVGFKHSSLYLSYFFWIGLAFMFVEIFFIHRFSFYLGNITYSFAIVLTALLVASGLGAIASHRISFQSTNKVILILSALILFYSLLLGKLLNASMGFSFWIKLLITFKASLVPGFLMGMPLPLGLKQLNERFLLEQGADTHHPAAIACFQIDKPRDSTKKITSFAIALNSFASVIGSVAAFYLSTLLGFTSVLVVASCFYLLALLSKNTR